MWLFPESGPKKAFRVTVSLKTVTPNLHSIVPNFQRHMAYFALLTGGTVRLTLGMTVLKRLTRSQNIFTRLTYGEAHEHTRVPGNTRLSFPGGLSGRHEVKDREGRANDTLVLSQPLAKVHVAFGSCWPMTAGNHQSMTRVESCE